ncbi:MAG: 1-deoxy-D-xylulose-5-phosphate reductoisomerase [Clostridia bacterium]|nr:1-deoxy-D-xylulose-5-phosphate reductoisomerase [Clostridia bacterium]
MQKDISILGSTGSIGTQTLEVCEELGIKVRAISANKNIDLLEKQVRKFKPDFVAVFDENSAKILKQNIIDTDTKVLVGMPGLCEISTLPQVDIVLTAVSGMIGLEPTLAAIDAGKTIALANKETLVAGGELVMHEAKKNGVQILPVDSEHSAIFQCLGGKYGSPFLEKLILTASGGPFFGKTKSELESVTLADALNHPSWSMGSKITVDSATIMNKGFEIIEACHLFGLPEDKIDVAVHRESIIHSMIEYVDGSVIAQMGVPTMKTPIQYALTYPERLKSQTAKLNLAKIKNLSFFKPDNKVFEAMNICREAVKIGGTAPLVVNAANEVAVSLFLSEKIKFLEIIELVKTAQKHFKTEKISSLTQILETDKAVREFIKSLV